MKVLVNGKFQTQVSALDRGLLYGQSVFETIAMVNGQAGLLEAHLSRLLMGARKLNILININDIKRDLKVIYKYCESTKSVLRITLTMGVGGRGYANPATPSATRILSLHDYPEHPTSHASDGITLGLSDIKLAAQPLLAGIKHGNRLEQTLARARWQPEWHEAILLDRAGNVVEGTQSNVLVVKNQCVKTPLLDQCGVDGVMKNWALTQLKEAGFSIESVRLSLHNLIEADEVLLTNSIIGVWPVKKFQDHEYGTATTAQQLTRLLHQHEIIPRH